MITGEILSTESEPATAGPYSTSDGNVADEMPSPIPEPSSSTALVSPTGAHEDEAGGPVTADPQHTDGLSALSDEPDIPPNLRRGPNNELPAREGVA